MYLCCSGNHGWNIGWSSNSGNTCVVIAPQKGSANDSHICHLTHIPCCAMLSSHIFGKLCLRQGYAVMVYTCTMWLHTSIVASTASEQNVNVRVRVWCGQQTILNTSIVNWYMYIVKYISPSLHDSYMSCICTSLGYMSRCTCTCTCIYLYRTTWNTNNLKIILPSLGYNIHVHVHTCTWRCISVYMCNWRFEGLCICNFISHDMQKQKRKPSQRMS